MTIRIAAQDVRRFSLESLRPFARDNPEFYAPAGKEHYRLLAYLSTQVSGTIIDVGTHRGASALALSYNPENIVLTFDVEERTPSVVDHRRNICRFVEDLTEPEVWDRHRKTILASALVLIDVDPHDGEKERYLIDKFRDYEYRGIILLDDVWHFKALREKVWYQIPRAEKIDLTSVGHWSGTGLVHFGDDRPIFDDEPPRERLAGWTLVTGYFDLTKEPDSNPELAARSPAYYLEEHSTSTLALEHDLVVFTEPEFEEVVWRKRPKWLHDRTKVVKKRFSDFPLFEYREEIWANRSGHHCARDPRNTASYYLFCMARCAMMKEAIATAESPFYAWINVCIERYGANNVRLLDEALACRREKFSTCRIGYARPNQNELGAFFGVNGCADPASTCGGCTFCSAFYTGGRRAMVEVCDRMENEFLEALSKGYGHADEQIIALVHARHPELFEWYPGDYAQAITNYARVREHAESPIRNLLLPAVGAGDWETATRAAGVVWDSYEAGLCSLSEEDLGRLFWAMREVRKHT